MDSAEQAALTPQTDNGQTFKYYNARKLNIFGSDGRPTEGSREMTLTANPHFEYLPVNTTFSSVLMPPKVDDTGIYAIKCKYCTLISYFVDPEVMNSIQWSEHLDPLFINNYESDPSLSWQYFGSSTGFLRRYPGTIYTSFSNILTRYRKCLIQK